MNLTPKRIRHKMLRESANRDPKIYVPKSVRVLTKARQANTQNKKKQIHTPYPKKKKIMILRWDAECRHACQIVPLV